MSQSFRYPCRLGLRVSVAERDKLRAVAQATRRSLSDVLRVLVTTADLSVVERQEVAFGARYGNAARARRAAAKG